MNTKRTVIEEVYTRSVRQLAVVGIAVFGGANALAAGVPIDRARSGMPCGEGFVDVKILASSKKFLTGTLRRRSGHRVRRNAYRRAFI
jgi:hypothetical protein